MNKAELALIEVARQFAEEIPSLVHDSRRAWTVIQLIPRPIDRLKCHWIKTIRIEQGGLIVIPQNGGFAIFNDEIKAFTRVGPVANDVTEAVNFIHRDLLDISQHRLKCLQIAVDVAYERSLHRCFLI